MVDPTDKEAFIIVGSFQDETASVIVRQGKLFNCKSTIVVSSETRFNTGW